jgi:hypothetical protein
MIQLVKVGEWILNVQDVAAVRYEDTPDGPAVEIFTVSGGESRRQQKGGFSAKGQEAVKLWEYFSLMSEDVMSQDGR